MNRLSKFLTISVLALLFLCRGSASVTYEFKGTIDYSTSSVYTLGQSLDLTISLPSAVPTFGYQVIPGWWSNYFGPPTTTLTIAGTSYSLPPIGITTSGSVSPFGDEYGFIAQGYNLGLPNLSQFEFGFWSSLPQFVDSNFLPLPGLPVSDFTGPLIRVFDDTFGVAGNYWTGMGEAQITSYSVQGLSTPEDSSTLFSVGLGIAAMLLPSLRQKRRGAALVVRVGKQ